MIKPKMKIRFSAMEGIRLVPRSPRLKPEVRRDIFGDPDLKLVKKRTFIIPQPQPKKIVFPHLHLPALKLDKLKQIFSRKPKIQSVSEKTFVPPIPITPPAVSVKPRIKLNFKKLLPQKITVPKLPPVKKLFSLQNGLITAGCIGIILLLIFSANNTFNKAQAAKNNVYQDASKASEYLKVALAALNQSDFKTAQANFQKAEFAFSDARKSISWVGFVPRQAIEYTPHYGDVLKSGGNTIEAGYHLSRAAQYLLKYSEPIFLNGGKSFVADNYKTKITSTDSLTTKLKNNQEYFDNGLKEIEKANANLDKIIVSELPEDIQPIINQLKNNLPDVENKLVTIDKALPQILKALGSEETRHYLVLFQNNTEIRATGGFIGSYAIIHVYQGQVRKFFVDNIYNPDGLLSLKIDPPKPMQQRKIYRWKMRDSNWSPDFPTAAQKAAWFYEKEGGETVDGVIAIDNSLIEDLLKVTGPVTIKKYNTTLNSENFTKTTQVKVERDYTNIRNPKEFLIDFAPLFLKKLTSEKNKWLDYLDVVSQDVKQKHLLAFSYNALEQKLLLKNDLGGEIKESDNQNTDYLSVVNSNLAGNKSTIAIEETIQSATAIATNGEITRTVTITHKHKGTKQFQVKNSVMYTRILVPQGSTLLTAKGNRSPIDIETEKGKTVFGTWLITKKKETSRVTLTYRLPFQLKTSVFNPQQKYLLYVQKQSGSRGSKLEAILETIAPLKIELKNLNSSTANSSVNYSTILDTDKEIIGIIKK